MKRWTWTALFCIAASIAAQAGAQGQGSEKPQSSAVPASSCADDDCRHEATHPRPGALIKTSERARAIARKLDATGYYSRYSRALKGYPHLRSKRDQPRHAGTFALNSENRRRYRSQIQEIGLHHSLDYHLIDAVIMVESGYNPNAISPKGAMGLMQLKPATATRFNVADPFDPADNVDGGARYLRWLMHRFDGDLQLVLAAYNAGENSVANNGNRIPPYPETRVYVQRVLGLYKP